MRGPVTRSIFIFAASAFAGPLIRWATWPPSPIGQGSGFSTGDFVYNLVLLLWPTQPLAVIEASTGQLVALAVSVGANVLLFGVAGLVVGIFARRPAQLVVLYLAACVLVLIFALWLSGFSFAYLNLIALVVAFILYAVPFFAVFRLAHRPA